MTSRFLARSALQLASFMALTLAAAPQRVAAQTAPATAATQATAPEATPNSDVAAAPAQPSAATPANPAPAEAAPLDSATAARLDAIDAQLEALSHLKITGYVQAQYIRNGASRDGLDTSGKPLNKDEFEIRRARLRATYRQGPAELVLNVDAIPSGVSVKEAEVSVYLPTGEQVHSEITAGLFYIPFGYEVQESDSILPFVERTTAANRLFPGSRDLGVRVQGDVFRKALVYQIAIMNGQTNADAVFPGLDPNGAKDFVGRIGTQVGGLRAGISGLWGTGYLPAAVDDVKTTTVDETHGYLNFTHRAAAVDVSYELEVPSLGALTLYAEGTLAHDLDRSKLSDYPKIAQHTASGKTVAGKSVVDGNQLGGYVGVLQHLGHYVAVGARGELFDPHTAKSGDTLSALTLVGHVFPVDPMRLTVAYQLNFETPSVANNVFWLRGQVKF